jgi:hypothetical protein
MKLLQPYSPQVILGAASVRTYIEVRGLVESTEGGCYCFVSEGTLKKETVAGGPTGQQEAISDQRTFEGWRKFA